MRPFAVSILFPWFLAAQGVVSVTGGMVTPGQPPKPEPPSYKPEELCTVEGIVRHAISGEPLRKAGVTLMRMEARGNTNPPATTTTNSEGKFAMKNIEPGRYRIMAQRNGFVNSEFGMPSGNRPTASLTLEKGQTARDVEIKLTPHSVVTGRIIDEDGDPVTQASVALIRHRYFQGRKMQMPMGHAQSNDLGEYRMFGVPPGRYYVSVSASRNYLNFGVDRSAARQPEEANASATYYPSTTEIQSATQISVPLGGTVQGIDIRLRKERVFRVKGKVTGFPAGARGGGMVNLVRRDGGADVMTMGRDSMASWRAPGGEFEMPGVRPGSYFVRAMYYEPDQQLSGSATVEVTDGDVEGVGVMLTQGLEIAGSVRAEGGQAIDLEALSVRVESRTNRFMMMGNTTGRVKASGAFSINRVNADHYDLRLTGQPAEYYVKSIRTTDRDVLESGLDLQSGVSASGVEITLSAAAARLEGSVTDSKGNPAKGAAVVLKPKSGKAWELAQMRPVISDQYGKFRQEGLAPGEYLLLAFENVDPNEATDPDFLKDYESKAETVKFGEGAKETRQIKAIAVEVH